MEENRGTWIIVGIVTAIVLLVVCTCCAAGALLIIFMEDNYQPSPAPPVINPVPQAGTPTVPSPDPIVLPTQEPLPSEAAETLDAIREAEIPDADLHELGIRFRGVDPDTPRLSQTESPDYPVGTRREFRVSNVDTDTQFDIYATLVYKTEHVYMWVEEGAQVDEERIREAADLFEEHTYPTNREFFGTEWQPGVDSDPHLSILHARGLGNTVAGYFSSPDSYVQEVRADSNEMEMFYINIANVTIGSDFYNGVLAHEFQHMIHWYNDGNEDTWLNEGCSELAMALNDREYPGGYYDVGGSEYAYLRNPDTQLTTWPEGTAGDASANYGASYLFMSYFLDRFGDEATKALVSHTENGMDSVDAVLREELGLSITHRDFFADWVVANLLDNEELEDGRYGYSQIDILTPDAEDSFTLGSSPVTQRGQVHQYGVDYIEITSHLPVRFSFNGLTQVGLIEADAHSGKYLWWSNRADESDARISRVVDLTGAEDAELSFWTWYSIEEDWDYGYVVVGTTESGEIPDDLSSDAIDWEILDDSSLGCRESDPNGNNFGCGLTGSSSGWKELIADLSPYTGQEIVVRFEYITDAAVNQPGFTIDDVTLTVDGDVRFSDDVEKGEDEWIAEGFVRHANVLPQEWIVQLVMENGGAPRRLLMADGTSGEWRIPFSGDADRAVLVISALAPITTERADYEFTLTPEE